MPPTHPAYHLPRLLRASVISTSPPSPPPPSACLKWYTLVTHFASCVPQWQLRCHLSDLRDSANLLGHLHALEWHNTQVIVELCLRIGILSQSWQWTSVTRPPIHSLTFYIKHTASPRVSAWVSQGSCITRELMYYLIGSFHLIFVLRDIIILMLSFFFSFHLPFVSFALDA